MDACCGYGERFGMEGGAIAPESSEVVDRLDSLRSEICESED